MSTADYDLICETWLNKLPGILSMSNGSLKELGTSLLVTVTVCQRTWMIRRLRKAMNREASADSRRLFS